MQAAGSGSDDEEVRDDELWDGDIVYNVVYKNRFEHNRCLSDTGAGRDSPRWFRNVFGLFTHGIALIDLVLSRV